MDLVSLGPLDSFRLGTLRMVRAGGRRLLVANGVDGLAVTDLACPHQGYALTQGELGAEGTLTCFWHNWKFRLADGRCLVGEEDLRLYPTSVRDGTVIVEVRDPPLADRQSVLLGSLRRGIDDGYVGQISRDVVRLLRAEADPVQLVWEAVAWGAPRAEFGFGHAMASLVDCLDAAMRADGDLRALPIVQAFAGITETERRRPVRPQPEPVRDLPSNPAERFAEALEAEDLMAAEGLLRGAIAAGTEPESLRRWLIAAVGAHHMAYGHAAIYVQKAFALLDMLGWERADTVLPHLVPALGYATREDRLPYMRTYVKAIAEVDLAAYADKDPDPSWQDNGHLKAALLGCDPTAVVRRVDEALRDGAGVEGLLDAVIDVGAHRLLHFDPAVEGDPGEDFGWLDITHVVTYAHAARWAWRADPGPGTVRLALWAAYLALYAGRRGYREVPGGAGPVVVPDPDVLCREALSDRAGSFIVAAHLVKTSAAARAEDSDRPNSDLIAGTHRFVHAPRRERFVNLEVHRAIRLADGHAPR